jgi:ankyrin repeat protein
VLISSALKTPGFIKGHMYAQSSRHYRWVVPDDINQLDWRGFTALHRAINEKDRGGFLQLLQDGADVGALTKSGDNPLHLAAKQGCAGLIPLLIRPTTLDQQDRDGQTPLQVALQHSQLEAAAVLMASGASLSASDATDTPLILACMSQCMPELPLLVLNAMLAGFSGPELAGAVRSCGYADVTALHLAAGDGCQELVAKLLKAGADKEAVDKDGNTPLPWAAHAGHAHMVPLLATPTNINLANRLGCTPLLDAAAAGHDQAVSALLAAGAHADTCNNEGHSALRMAAARGHTRVVALLLGVLAKECKPSEQQQKGQAQELSQPQQGGQKKDQQGQVKLVQLISATLGLLAKQLQDAPRCSQLLGVVLDVLGPGVAGEVCKAAQQQLQPQQDEEQAGDPQNRDAAQASHLAEALLLGWVGTLEQLHAARQPVLARLQRLVPGVGSDPKGEAEQAGKQAHSSREQHESEPEVQDVQLEGLVKQAALAAAAGKEEEACRLVEKLAALHLQQQQKQQQQQKTAPKASYGQPAPATRVSDTAAAATATLQLVVHQGLKDAAEAQVNKEGNTPVRSSAVYTTFLAAWVGAHRQLQQLPQEVAAAVVAAVKADREQQQGRELGPADCTLDELDRAIHDWEQLCGPPPEGWASWLRWVPRASGHEGEAKGGEGAVSMVLPCATAGSACSRPLLPSTVQALRVCRAHSHAICGCVCGADQLR